MIHHKYTQEQPRINRQDRQKITFTWIWLPQDLQTAHSRYTHRSSALPEDPFRCLPSPFLTTKDSWIHLWAGSLSLLSALWRYGRSSVNNSTTQLCNTAHMHRELNNVSSNQCVFQRLINAANYLGLIRTQIRSFSVLHTQSWANS